MGYEAQRLLKEGDRLLDIVKLVNENNPIMEQALPPTSWPKLSGWKWFKWRVSKMFWGLR